VRCTDTENSFWCQPT